MKYEITLDYNEQTKNGKELIKKIYIEQLEKKLSLSKIYLDFLKTLNKKQLIQEIQNIASFEQILKKAYFYRPYFYEYKPKIK